MVKKFKFLFLFILLIMPAIILCGCGGETNETQNPIKLSEPVLSWEDGKINWTPVANAVKYEISINDEISYSYNTFINLNITSQKTSYNIKVKSISEDHKYLNSEFSQPMIFDTLKLVTPYTIIGQIDNQKDMVKFTWNINNLNELYVDYFIFAINNYSYNIPIGDITIKNQSLGNTTYEYSFSKSVFQQGKNIITIKSYSDNSYFLSSDISNCLEIEIYS